MLGPIIAAALSAGGAIINNRSNQKFADRMSGTSYQRAVKDMRAAGLNPALAYSQGGASTPSVSTENPAAGAVSNALSARQVMAQVEQTKALTRQIDTDTELKKFDLLLRSFSQNGTPSWLDEKLAERSGRMRDIKFAGKMQPHDLRLREIQRAIQELVLPRERLKTKLYRDVEGVTDLSREGYRNVGNYIRDFIDR